MDEQSMSGQMPDQQSQPQDQEPVAGMMVPIKALGVSAQDLKPGSEISFKVDAIHGDMVELSPCGDDDDSDESEMPSEDEAKKMPMDELESKLPQAER